MSKLNQPSTMEELLAKSQYKPHGLKKGQEIEGIITAATPAGIYLDINGKTEGLVLEKDKKILADLLSNLKVGDKVQAVVLNPESEDGYAVLSLRRQRKAKGWQKILEALKNDQTLNVLVTDITRNGLLVEYSSIRGFLPTSHLLSPDKKVGDTLEVKVLEASASENRLILSQKAVLANKEQIRKNLAKIKINEIYEGTITGITKFGLFVSILGVEGLVHVSEISWERAGDLEKKFKIGQNVKVLVISVDIANLKLNLSIKQILPDPFFEVSRKFSIDQSVQGMVYKILKTGVQVQIDGAQGFIHNSKIPPDITLTEGKKVVCTIESIDNAKRRINLIPVLKEKPIGYR